MTENLYDYLEIPTDSSEEDIKKAYRKLSLQYHPDRNGNSSESTIKIQGINAAYETLSDDQKRSQYDMQRKFGGSVNGMPFGMPFNMSFSPGGGGGPTFFTTSNAADMDPANILNFFSNSFFGPKMGMGMGMGPQGFNLDTLKQTLAKPTPIIKTETITLSKAFTGYNMPVEITRWIVENNVKREETETIYLPIPRGVDNNEIIILREKGNMLNEHNRGDIKIFIKIQNDTEFTRNGLDLILNKTISLKDALCGFLFDMNYLDGRVFKINNNVGNIITNNYNKVLTGMGMKREEHVGNLIINFNVTFPEKLSEEQVEALKKIL
jgi:DnaJ-class molecular chaperone